MAVLQGKVELIATISKEGVATNIRVTFGPEPLSTPARQMLEKWRFAACGCEAKFDFTFELSGSCYASEHCPTGFEVELPGKIKVTGKAINAIVN
jgi:Gram-negative bacterial TonB protein C-terminal